MSTLLALQLGSALVGFVIGLNFGLVAVALVSPIIAAVVAVSARDLHFTVAMLITLASLVVNQLAYLIGFWMRNRSMTEESDNRISRER